MEAVDSDSFGQTLFLSLDVLLQNRLRIHPIHDRLQTRNQSLLQTLLNPQARLFQARQKKTRVPLIHQEARTQTLEYVAVN